MTKVTPTLENTRFSPFFILRFYDHPALKQGSILHELRFLFDYFGVRCIFADTLNGDAVAVVQGA